MVTIMLALSLLVAGCGQKAPAVQKIDIDSEYKAVFLDNSQVFFGKLVEAGPTYIELSDVFYVQSQVIPDKVDKDKKEVKNILIKRGNEWHAPDRMYINIQHVVVSEPVSRTSRVSDLIKEAKGQK